MTGALTVLIFASIGLSLFTGGNTGVGGLLMAGAVFRGVMLYRQWPRDDDVSGGPRSGRGRPPRP